LKKTNVPLGPEVTMSMVPSFTFTDDDLVKVESVY